MKRWLLILAAAMWLSPLVAKADIDCRTTYDIGEPIVITVTPSNMPEGAVIRKARFAVEGATFVKVNETTFHVWCKEGKYTITARGTWRLSQPIIDKQDKEWQVIVDEDDYEFSKTFAVGPEVPVPPPFPPVPPGERRVVILEESVDRTAAQALLWQQLRKEFPQSSQLEILDDDQPASLKYLPLVARVTARPALFLC